MSKHLLALLLSGALFWGIHSQICVQFFDTGTIDQITAQHTLLLSITLFAYITFYIASRFIPTQVGFVFMGLLIAKIIIATMFVQQQGWLDDPTTTPKRALFLCFYFGYVVCLLLVSINIIKRANP